MNSIEDGGKRERDEGGSELPFRILARNATQSTV